MAIFALIVESVRNAPQQFSLYLKRLGEVKKFKSTINANIAFFIPAQTISIVTKHTDVQVSLEAGCWLRP